MSAQTAPALLTREEYHEQDATLQQEIATKERLHGDLLLDDDTAKAQTIASSLADLDRKREALKRRWEAAERRRAILADKAQYAQLVETLADAQRLRDAIVADLDGLASSVRTACGYASSLAQHRDALFRVGLQYGTPRQRDNLTSARRILDWREVEQFVETITFAYGGQAMKEPATIDIALRRLEQTMRTITTILNVQPEEATA